MKPWHHKGKTAEVLQNYFQDWYCLVRKLSRHSPWIAEHLPPIKSNIMTNNSWQPVYSWSMPHLYNGTKVLNPNPLKGILQGMFSRTCCPSLYTGKAKHIMVCACLFTVQNGKFRLVETSDVRLSAKKLRKIQSTGEKTSAVSKKQQLANKNASDMRWLIILWRVFLKNIFTLFYLDN